MSLSAKQYINDAINHYKEHCYQEALHAFERAIRIDPHNVKAHHGRGIVLMQMKEYEKAVEAFEQALNLAPKVAKIREDMAGAKKALSKLQNNHASPTFFDAINSYQSSSQPSKVQLAYEAMYNNQWDLSPSIHPANCRCPQCWES